MRIKPYSLVIVILLTCIICVAQTPQPKPNMPNLSLVPLTLLSVGLDDIAKPVTSPTGATFPTPEFFIPRNGTKTLDFITSGGSVNVNFSNSVPPGVPGSAFEWVRGIL